MAVMTHAHPRLEPGTADYKSLSPEARQAFDQLMDQADIAGPHDYPVYMKAVAILAGLPAGDLRKCACSCCCSVVFDANNEDAHVIETSGGYNLGRHQCPWCADQHRETA
jgi:hypothetical protein